MKKRKKAKAKKRPKYHTISILLEGTHRAAVEEVAEMANRSVEDVCVVMLAMGMYMHRKCVIDAGDKVRAEALTPAAAPADASPSQADLPESAGAPA